MKLKVVSYLLLVLLTLGFVTAPKSYAQTFTVQNGAAVSVQNSGTLNLDSTTTLSENNGRVTGNGQVKAVRTLNAPSGQDVAGLGAVITSGQNLGQTTVIRSHAEQSVGNRKSVQRYYEIIPTTNSGLNSTLAFNYADAELNSLPENDLTLFRSDDNGATYSAAGYDSRDASSNTITLSGIDSFARFSAAAPDLFNYGSLALNGVDQYMDISSVAGDMAGASTFSVSFWVKPDFANQTDDSGVAPFGLNDASGNVLFHVLIGAPGTQDQIVRIFDSSGLPQIEGATLTGDTWHHISFTYDNGTATLYVDGRSAGQSSMSLTLSTDDQWSIGQRFDSGTPSDFLDGKVDEVRIWNAARSGQQIRNNVFQPLEGDETGLTGYWSLNNGAKGSSTNSNDGTLLNNPSFNSDTYPKGTFITGSEGWHMMSSPVSGASYSTLLDTLWLQGISQGGDVTNGSANLYNWDEANYQFNAIDDATVNVPASEGFIFYVYNDQNYDGTPEGFPKMIRTGQEHRSGNVSPTVIFTDKSDASKEGWNLTGNPYGATIDWDASSGWTKTNLDNTIYVWSESAGGGSGDYLTWNGSTGTLGNGLIAPWQSFWVKANASGPVLEFTDEVRAAGGEFLKDSESEPVPEIKFDLVQNSTDSLPDMQSAAVLMFDEQVKAGKDPFDAWKLKSLNREHYLSLYTTSREGYALDINALPVKPEEPLETEMAFRGSNTGGEYTLRWNPRALPSKMGIILKDTHTDRVINLNEAGEYTFKVEEEGGDEGEDDKSRSKSSAQSSVVGQPPHGTIPTVMKAKAANPRFIISINPEGANKNLAEIPDEVILNQNYPNPFNPTTVIQFGVPEQADVQLTVYDVLGRKVRTLINEQKAPGTYEASFDASTLASGLYLYRLKIGTNVLTKKMMLIK